MKKMVLSAVALIGFTVASYGANTVEVEVESCLEQQEVVGISADMGCVELFNYALASATNLFGNELGWEIAEDAYDNCMERTKGKGGVVIQN